MSIQLPDLQTPAAVDFSQLEMLEMLQEDDEGGLIEDIFNEFKVDLAELFRRLGEAESGPDFSDIRAIAHTIKGSAASFGMDQVAAIALGLEQAADADDSSLSRELSESLKAAYAIAVDEVESFFARA